MNTSQAAIDGFLAQKTLAVAGVSRGGKKFGNTIHRQLKEKGYRVFVVHPEAREIGGEKCYPSISQLPESVGGIVIAVAPEKTVGVLLDAAAAGIKRVWIQQGTVSREAREFCRNNGMDAVIGECVLMHVEPRGVHAFHRWMRGILGRLPR